MNLRAESLEFRPPTNCATDTSFVSPQPILGMTTEEPEETVLDASIQKYYDTLTTDERDILEKLDYYCFDQGGCRMLQ